MTTRAHRSSRLLAKAGALVAAAGLAVSLTATPADAARGASGAGDWLVTQLDGGLVHNDQYDFDDYGLTADVAIALDAVGGHRAAEARTSRALAKNVESYITGVDFGSSDRYAGSTAKALVVAQVTGGKPRSFGGVNLVRRLAGLTTDAGVNAGRIADRGSADYANTFGQAFAVRGLGVAGHPEAGRAAAFLLKQQCAAGFFRASFAPADRAQQRCGAAPAAERQPSTDATALAVVNLQALPRKSAAVKRSIARASAWLARTQRDNGSFGSDAAIRTANSNSTGLASWALAETGRCPAAVKAARWVGGLQKPNGAIAYDRAALAAGRDGIDTTEQDQWRRATAQAAPALLNTSAAACRG